MACTVPYAAQPSWAASPPFQGCRRSYSSSSSSLSPAAKPFQPRILVQWQPPARGWFKLNFDGSFCYDTSKRASIGGVIRNCAGDVMVAFAEPTEHTSVGEVEARAFIRGLRLALDNFIGRLVVEGDDLMLVKLLRGEDTASRITPDLQAEIMLLLGQFSACVCVVQHIYREGNQVADALCHEAYHTPGMWKGGLGPVAVAEKVDEDRCGVVHERIRKNRV